MFGIITIAIEMADSGEPQVSVSADTQKKHYFVSKMTIFEHFGV